jgi:hypothetical protein
MNKAEILHFADRIEDEFRKLKKAWEELNRAESDMARMRSFPKMSFSMKVDFSKASMIATEARRTIDSILGGVR